MKSKHGVRVELAESALEKFRAAAAEREKKHDEIERKRKEDAAQGKENMSGAIDRLEKHLNREDVPVNNVSGGQIAGVGVGPQGEPGVKKKKKTASFISFMTRQDKK
jgi:hypothetical protein